MVLRFVEEVCLCYYKYSVIKFVIVCVLERKLLNIFLRIIYDNLDIEIKILYVVCDLRGFINFRINFGWIKDVD